MRREIVFSELSFIINGLLFDVHNELGRFCNEKQYGDCFEKKLQEKSIKYEKEKILPKSFESEKADRNRKDFLIDDKIIVEFKCKRVIERVDYYQAKRYLISLNKKLGIIVNFREKYIRPHRILNSQFVDTHN
ncbi:MAG: GxxExxY protein [Patescibacteria group bacterium]|nr:GxxExxY protein [Patescibacteria group bacterium]